MAHHLRSGFSGAPWGPERADLSRVRAQLAASRLQIFNRYDPFLYMYHLIGVQGFTRP